MEISDLRQQIDSIDEQLLDLFLKRMDLAGQIGENKAKKDLPILNQQREQEILAQVAARSGSLEQYARDFFRKLFVLSRFYQLKLFPQLAANQAVIGKSSLNCLEACPLKVYTAYWDMLTDDALMAVKRGFSSAHGIRLLLLCPHQAGSLAGILATLADWEINILKLETFPFTEDDLQCQILLELEGKMSDPQLASMLEKLVGDGRQLLYLGNYGD